MQNNNNYTNEIIIKTLIYIFKFNIFFKHNYLLLTITYYNIHAIYYMKIMVL